MIQRVQAIVLRVVPYGDTSAIVALYTLENGRIDCIAKGLRSKAGARKFTPLYPGSRIQAVVYIKPQRDLQLLTECSLREPNYTLLADPTRMVYVQLIIELFTKAVPEHEPMPDVFALLEDTLADFDKPDVRLFARFAYFLLQLMAPLGCQPQPCANIPPGNTVVLRLEAGILAPVIHSPNNLGEWLNTLLLSDREQATKLQIPKSVRPLIVTELLQFLTYHLHTDFTQLRSLRIFEEIFQE